MDFIKLHRRRVKALLCYDRALLSGSLSEMPAAYFLTRPTDIDFMIYQANVCAVPKNMPAPGTFRGEVLTIEPHGLPRGYVKLRKSTFKSPNTEGEENYYQKHLEKFTYDIENGPAFVNDVGWSTFTLDNVFSIQCPYWPPEAEEWQTRHRPHGWPSNELIGQVVSEGCFLVGKSHPNFKDDDKTQWRYSFSKAEQRLISSWTYSQMYVYHVLRLIKTEIVMKYDDMQKTGLCTYDDMQKTGLCTYHLKTQMLWACEEKPPEFWDESNLLTCICELLSEIVKRFAVGNFPNYFLRESNIIEGNCMAEDCRDAIRILNTEIGRNYLKSMLPPKTCHECRISITFPTKIALHLQLFADRFDFQTQASCSKLQELIDKEMDELMNGIYNMQLAQTMGHSYYAMAEQHFWNLITCEDSVSNNSEVKRVTLTIGTSLNLVTSLYESLENDDMWTFGKERNTSDVSMVTSCTNSECPCAGRSVNFPWNEVNGKFHEKWINPFHVLSAAYLSNIYFTTGNYELCRKMVQEEQLVAEAASYGDLFPMIFSPELANLFDENIQEVLGLIWLFKRLGRSGVKNFEFCTCPHLFLRYICIQSSLRLGYIDSIDIYYTH